MQRSKAAVRLEVKQVIGALCRLLAAAGLESVPAPDTFRRAKFSGGPEVEDQFWRLLANILQTCDAVTREASAQQGGAAEHRRLVAAGLWQTGFHADWMYESGGGERVSSRDLLLALGWLLATGKLEELVMLQVQQLDKTLLTPTPGIPQLSNELQLDSACLRKLQWLVGRLRFQERTLLSLQEERTRLLHAVFVASLPSSVSSDQSSAALRKECVCVQQLCGLLEAYVNWKQEEKVFWTWMDSVVDCHLTDPVVNEPTHAQTKSAGRCRHGNRGLEKFEDMLLRLPTGQTGQTSGRGGERPQGGPDTSRLPPLFSSLHHPQVYRARLLTERPVGGRSHPAEGARGGADTPDELPASQAASLLLQTEAALLERRDGQRLTNRVQLQEAISRLEPLMLIPP